MKEKASMNIGEAVRERIIELCRESELFRNLEQEVK